MEFMKYSLFAVTNSGEPFMYETDDLDEMRKKIKAMLPQFNSGYIRFDGQIEWMFYRRYNMKVHWEHWNQHIKLFQ